MKKLIFLMAFLFPAIANADCYQIKDRDAQYMCLAKTKHDYNYCFQIKDRDQQYYCQAIIKHEYNYCYQIKAKDLQQECLALTR